MSPATTTPQESVAARKTRTGYVVSSVRDKTITVRLEKCGAANNSATVSGDQTDPIGANYTSTTTVIVTWERSGSTNSGLFRNFLIIEKM